jgi:hypothetical protein
MAPVPGDSSKHQFGTSMPQGGHPPHHSRLPAHAGTPEEMLGVVQAKDLLDRISARPLAPPNGTTSSAAATAIQPFCLAHLRLRQYGRGN